MKIRLMAEYECHPLWRETAEGLENVDPDSLGLSTGLLKAIEEWDAEYQKTYVSHDPVNSGFCSIELQRDFENKGVELNLLLESELKGRNRSV